MIINEEEEYEVEEVRKHRKMWKRDTIPGTLEGLWR